MALTQSFNLPKVVYVFAAIICGVYLSSEYSSNILAECKSSRQLRVTERQVVIEAEAVLDALNKTINSEDFSPHQTLAEGYTLRTKELLASPVDHLHDRCWYEDQLSCSTLLSSLYEIRSFVRSLNNGAKLESLSQLEVTIQRKSENVHSFCKSLPWRLN